MVEHLEHTFGLLGGNGVVQRRHHVFQQHEDAVHQRCRQMQTATRAHCGNDAEGNGRNSQQGTDAMGYRVGDLFPKGVSADGFAGIALSGIGSRLLLPLGTLWLAGCALLELTRRPFL